ncbi:hypothetical protein LWI29_021571 [Acer saccharum]|uniref:Uncharacterized protein n=1 Tax=Acer saccharum TaxID=4024 RepID=A0AA39S693_ACESA|nr:hypothetical protein LWI29_021571 [Acer saccharum]
MKVPAGRNGKRRVGKALDPVEVQLKNEFVVGIVEVDPPEDLECNLLTRKIRSEKRKATSHPTEPVCKVSKLPWIDSRQTERTDAIRSQRRAVTASNGKRTVIGGDEGRLLHEAWQTKVYLRSGSSAAKG